VETTRNTSRRFLTTSCIMFYTILLLAVYLGLASGQCGPSGAHLQSGTENCACSGNQISCDSFKICGVGNTNANVQLETSCTATVTCTNKGGKTVDVKTQPVTGSSNTGTLRAKNGCVTVPSLHLDKPSDNELEAAATCPNPNWSKDVVPESINCGFSETVTFVGCSSPWTTISGSCPT
jgi:hypothetical protein